MSGGVFLAEDVHCPRGHYYARPDGAPSALPCPTCVSGHGPYWWIPAAPDGLVAWATTEPSRQDVMRERLFRRVRVTHISGAPMRPFMPPAHRWIPGWLEESAAT